MRALLFAAVCSLAAACGARAQPYRFAMPMLGHADVPVASLDGRSAADKSSPNRQRSTPSTSGRPRTRYAYGWQTDAQAGIRVASAKGIELSLPEASAESADAVGHGLVISRLPAPNKPVSGVTSALELPRMSPVREPAGLRALVGTHDKRDPFAIAIGWLGDLGITFVEPGTPMEMAAAVVHAPTDGLELVTWAQSRGKLLPRDAEAQPGDLLVFDRATANEPSDLIAVVIGRDTRGVIELMYAGGGVIRRGYVDPAHPSSRRDLGGGVLNTFLRHGKQWPPKGTRYLSGELLAHVIRVH